MASSEKVPFLSVVVPALNAVDTIADCLRALRRHLPEGASEVIVVDNGSTDGTGQAAREENVRVVQAPGVFVSEVRNSGARHAAGDLFAFVDSDCTITPEWYQAVVDLLEGDGTIGAAGSRHVIPENPSWVEAVWFQAHHSGDRGGPREVAYVPAGNLVVRREVFLQVGGFDPTLETGEDPDLCNRIGSAGYRIVEWDRIRCIHLGEPKTLMQVFRREKWHGRGVRLRYADGRVSPVVLATALFLLLLLAGVTGLVTAGFTGFTLPAATAILALGIPALFAVVRSRTVPVVKLPALALVYTFYFLGRAASLPGAAVRAMFTKRQRSDG